MKRVSIVLMILCISCNKTESVRETLQILIQNRTENIISITLYPKKTSESGGFYPICEGCGGHNLTEFTLSPNDEKYYDWREVIYYTTELNIQPYALATNAFDSILISIADKEIKFTHKTVIGYSENIFSNKSTWEYQVVDDELPDMSSLNPQKYYCYIFSIMEDNLINEPKASH